jgi:transcriptional regulator of acetoin/glycerol metabolism
MEHLLPHVQASGGLILLADARGTVVASLGDDGFAGRARRVALRPGAQWSEALRGTNAIGTALAEDAPVTIHGGEHYLSRNGFLSCSAAPIHDPTGALLGVVDITGDQRAQHPATLPHVLGLACTAARMIEHRLFETWHAQALRLRFHARREGLGMLDEGLLAVSPEGQLLGANSVARELLGIARAAQGRWRVDTGLGLGVQTLFDWARCGQPQELADASGTRRWWRVDAAPQALRLVIDAGVEAASGGADAGVDGHGPAHPRAAPALERLMQVCNGDATEARRRWGLGVGSGYAQSNISPCETSALTIRPRVPEGARHTDRHPQGPDS